MIPNNSLNFFVNILNFLLGGVFIFIYVTFSRAKDYVQAEEMSGAAAAAFVDDILC